MVTNFDKASCCVIDTGRGWLSAGLAESNAGRGGGATAPLTGVTGQDDHVQEGEAATRLSLISTCELVPSNIALPKIVNDTLNRISQHDVTLHVPC